MIPIHTLPNGSSSYILTMLYFMVIHWKYKYIYIKFSMNQLKYHEIANITVYGIWLDDNFIYMVCSDNKISVTFSEQKNKEMHTVKEKSYMHEVSSSKKEEKETRKLIYLIKETKTNSLYPNSFFNFVTLLR